MLTFNCVLPVFYFTCAFMDSHDKDNAKFDSHLLLEVLVEEAVDKEENAEICINVMTCIAGCDLFR